MEMKRLFIHAKPVWVKGLSKEMNIHVLMRACFSCKTTQGVQCRIATSGIYNLYVNGVFAAYGPARAGKGFFRMDLIDISSLLKPQDNIITVEIAGYYVNSFYIQKQESFVQAEVVQDDEVLCSTGNSSFTAQVNPYTVRRVQRYSFQRPMIEAYRLDQNYNLYLSGKALLDNLEEQEVQEDKNIIERTVPYPAYEISHAKPIISGVVKPLGEPGNLYRDRSCTNIGPLLQGFSLEELDFCVTDEVQRLAFLPAPVLGHEDILSESNYQIYEFPRDLTGMPFFTVSCETDITLYCIFDEVLHNKDIDLPRSGCANVVKYELKKGFYELKFFEVYTMKYIKFAVIRGACKIEHVQMIEYKHEPLEFTAKVLENNKNLQKIADAALETFRQNAVDLFTDCPSRERAGWLCDSFFTARVEYILTGENKIEHSFLENFLCEDSYEFLPFGMIPQCYPADHNDGSFIPNWAMWLILELEEYRNRSGDEELVQRYKNKVLRLLDYFKAFENSDGLLENPDGCVFVEWSRANELAHDVNYPTNMLYSAALMAAARLYKDQSFVRKAEKLKAEILKQSYCDGFFVDNAVRRGPVLVPSGESTEVCQYYAFFFNIVTPQSAPELFQTLIKDFGPTRKQNNLYPQIAFANAFIGNYLRLDILVRYGFYQEVLDNIERYFLYMAEKTGTLWENDSDSASCNHGFASYVLYWLKQI